ncbi:ankyrin repeat-containing domain protein [Astrocystis sublimbata]|nr:ankyrin repeat-containing domain protein [Astrocystis sublimbata]
MTDEKILDSDKAAHNAVLNTHRNEQKTVCERTTSGPQDLLRLSESETIFLQDECVAKQLLKDTNSEEVVSIDGKDLAQNEKSGEPLIEFEDLDAFQRAIWHGNCDLAKEIISKHPTIGKHTLMSSRHSPLMLAMNSGEFEMVRLVLEAGADPNCYYWVGGSNRVCSSPFMKYPRLLRIYRTPLQLAAERGDFPVVKLLMETYHVDDSAVSRDGQLAFRLAAKNGHSEIATYLPRHPGGRFRRLKFRFRDETELILAIAEIVGIFTFKIPRLIVRALAQKVSKSVVARRSKRSKTDS